MCIPYRACSLIVGLFTVTDLYFSFIVADLFFALADFFLTLVDLSLTRSFVVFVAELSLSGFLSIGQALFKRLNNSHVVFTPNSSFISSHHFSSCTSNATLKSFLAHNCSCKLNTSCSIIRHCICKICFLFSKLAYNSTLPQTSL